MLVVMKKDSTPEQIEAVSQRIRELGFEAHPMPGAQRTAVCITGNKGAVATDRFARLPGILEIIRVSKPYKLVSREIKPDDSVLTFGDQRIGGGNLGIIAGPCTVETDKITLGIAERLSEMGVQFFRGGAYKPRTSPYDFQGLGKAGLEILAKVKREFGMNIVTEVMAVEDLPAVAEVADILQVGARNMNHSPLLRKLGTIDKPVLLKRGMSATLDEMFMAAEYIMSSGNYKIMLCERGIRTFANHSRFTLDISAIPAMKKISHLPVIGDPSHAAGVNDMVEPLGLASIAAGADGLIVEVHTDPTAAWCDGPQALEPEQMQRLIRKVKTMRAAMQACDEESSDGNGPLQTTRPVTTMLSSAHSDRSNPGTSCRNSPDCEC